MARYYFIAFFSGAVVLVLETLGARIMAPYVGTAYFVWVNIIGVMLAALSLGYWFGGRLADKTPRMLPIIFLAGAFSVGIIIPEIRLLPTFGTLGIRAGSLLAALLLLAPPSAVLGMVSPYLVKLAANDPQRVGTASGTVFAYSTLGSIAGTFLTGFILIPHFSIPHILTGMVAALVALSLISNAPRKLLPLLFIPLLFSAWDILHGGHLPGRVIYEENSPYYNIRVHDMELSDGRTLRTLLLDGSTQSARYIDEEEFPYVYIRLSSDLITAIKPAPDRMLALGGGGYSIPAFVKTSWPQSEITVAEIDPRVTETARDHFFDGAMPDMGILAEDARVFLNSNAERYDIIYTDAYSGAFAIPWHLATREAFLRMRDALQEDGVLVINVASALEGRKSGLFYAILRTMRSVFPYGMAFATNSSYPDTPQNAVVVAAQNASVLAALDNGKFNAYRYQPDDAEIERAMLLTDEFAPTDMFSEKLVSAIYPLLRKYQY